MDPSLLKERDAFKKRAMNAPLVEARKRPTTDQETSSKAKNKKAKIEKERVLPREFDYKASAGSSQYKFAILAKIVKELKKNHQNGVTEPIPLNDLLDETNQTDISARNKHWLETEALLNNPKVEVIEDGFKFKPVLNVRDKKSLLALLKEHERLGLGTIFMDDIEESVPNVAKVMKELKESVHVLTRQAEKKELVLYRNKADFLPNGVSEEIQKLWRSIAMDGQDEGKIEKYLQQHNLKSMKTLELKKVTAPKRKQGKRKAKAFKSHNEHMGDILKDYSEK